MNGKQTKRCKKEAFKEGQKQDIWNVFYKRFKSLDTYLPVDEKRLAKAHGKLDRARQEKIESLMKKGFKRGNAEALVPRAVVKKVPHRFTLQGFKLWLQAMRVFLFHHKRYIEAVGQAVKRQLKDWIIPAYARVVTYRDAIARMEAKKTKAAVDAALRRAHAKMLAEQAKREGQPARNLAPEMMELKAKGEHY
jgi:hypothetical protein